MLSIDMQSCTKKANVMYTGQGNKEQVSQDLKDGFLFYMLTTCLLMLKVHQCVENNYNLSVMCREYVSQT